jgi:glycosyltransferase involved in cell wall biosynthesis
MSQPTFSILSSAHETEAYTAELIDSVVAQTDPDWELIVVDNGMSDEIARIVGNYSTDPRIRLVRQDYQGLDGGVDAAAAAARGSYYAVVHGDDALEPTFCARTRAILDADQGIDAVVVDAFPFKDDGTLGPRSFHQLAGVTTEPGVGHPITLAEVAGGRVLYYTAAIRAAAWKLGGGYTCDTPKVEDLAMFLRMLVAGCDIRVLPEQLARYRLHDNLPSGERADQDEYEESVVRAYAKVENLTADPEVRTALAQRLRILRYEQAMRLARRALLASDTSTARDQARRALQQRRSLRPAVIYAALTLAPGALRHVHQVKQRLSGVLATIRSATRGRSK